MDEWYWKHFQRQHRTVGNYLALQAWVRDLDCIILTRKNLEDFFGIKSTTKKHIQHFTSDIKPYFEFSRPYYRKNSDTYIQFLFLSRVKFALPSRHGGMSANQLIEAIKSDLPKVARFSKPNVDRFFSQEEIISYLALLAAGQKIPQRPIESKTILTKRGNDESALKPSIGS